MFLPVVFMRETFCCLLRLLNRPPPPISLVLNQLLQSVKASLPSTALLMNGLYMNKTECGKNYQDAGRLSTSYTDLTLHELDMLLDFPGSI